MIRGYIRTGKGEDTLSIQVKELSGFDCEGLYIDEGVSRRAFVKPELTRLMGEVCRGDVIVVAALDRLAEYHRDISEFFAQCFALGVDVVVVREGLDTIAAPSIFKVMGAFVDFGSALDKERREQSLEKLGRKQGRPSKLTGDQKKEVLELKTSGKTVSAIAKHFDVSRAVIYSVLEVGEHKPVAKPKSAFASITRDQLRDIVLG